MAHSMPVSQMGNYQEYLKRIPSPLREVESTPVRQHTFGNPFKIDKVEYSEFYVFFVWYTPFWFPENNPFTAYDNRRSRF